MMRYIAALIPLLAIVIGLRAEPPKEQGDTKEQKHPANGLAGETSPYLLQHAHNPVNWQPWGRAALEKAKKEKKLIFLSIGYSSCHWCHVMEKESFSNVEVAKILNDNFVCIKVDREERPEVDEVYMTAVHAMGARGGWPLSIFLNAEGKPIIGGTYWPREDRVVDGETVNGFKSILNKIVGLQRDKPADMAKQADYFAEATQEVYVRNSRRNVLVAIDQAMIDDAFREYKEGFDPEQGGMGSKAANFDGTKFPMPSTWKFLLKYGREKNNDDARKMVHLTLAKMANGGIYDHLAGGFHRYSTERTWTVPHFEKMLYDNAQLIELYSLAYQDRPDPLYKQVVEQTVAFVLRDMASPEGLFYTAWDADSEGEEGRCYVWTEQQIDEAIGDPALAAIFKTRFGVAGKPNFEKKDYILRVAMDWKELAARFQTDEKTVREKVATASSKLLALREKRPKPFRDTKIITAWNGQMIAGLALAGQVFERKDWIAAAEKAARRIREVAVEKNRLQRIVAMSADGKSLAKINASLDDYAFLVHGLLNLHAATATAADEWKDDAGRRIAEMLPLLGDPAAGGFFMNAKDDDLLFVRVKDFYDNAQPAANNVMADDLLRFGAIAKEPKYAAEAERTIKQFAGTIRNSPTSAPVLLGVTMDYLRERK